MRWFRRHDPPGDDPPGLIRLVRRLAARSAQGGPPRVAVLAAPDTAGTLAQLRRALPGAVVVVAPSEREERHLALTAAGPFDLILDAPRARGRVRRFEDCFFHLRAGGAYVVPGGAGELDAAAGRLGELLQAAGARPAASVRAPGLRLAESSSRALRAHVRAETDGEHLVLTHDLPDVLAKVGEASFDRYLASTPHDRDRVLDVIPAAAPEPPPGDVHPAPTSRHTGRPIEAVPLSLRDHRDVVVGPFQMALSGRLVLPASYRRHRSESPRSNALNSVAPRFAVPAPPLPERMPRLDGTFVHLDNEARGHYGHLVVESLAKAWAWPRALEVDPDARVVVSATPKRPALLDYEVEIYEACGIPRERVVLVEGPTRVERLIAGTPALSNPHYAHPLIAETWQRVGDRLAAADRAVPAVAGPRRIFVGRREPKRVCHGGDRLEALFAAHGFEIVHPEDHPLGVQVRMFRGAEVVAGYAGSGLYSLAFVAEPTRVVRIASEAYHPRNEFLIAAVRGHRLDTVVCRSVDSGERGNLADFEYDDQREGPYVRALLADLDQHT